jgi:hypothetical protein
VALSASSAGQSVLVLPVQYSHCWRIVSGSNEATLFRANLMQCEFLTVSRLRDGIDELEASARRPVVAECNSIPARAALVVDEMHDVGSSTRRRHSFDGLDIGNTNTHACGRAHRTW